MVNFNRAIVCGTIATSPRLTHTDAGLSRVVFTVEIVDRYRDADGKDVSRSLYVDVRASGSQAEAIMKHLDEGSPILVEGRLVEAEDGRRFATIELRRFQFLPGHGPRKGR